MVWLYSVTVLLSACLLFLIQPMCAKRLLPLMGGTPAVWNTCMVFFQAGLLAGYAYAHAAPRWLGVGRHAVVHLGLMGAASFFLPIQLPEEVYEGWHPVLWLLASLTVSVGPPFICLASAAPLLQQWWVALRSSPAKPLSEGQAKVDPYFLYAASNLGSFVALVLFLFVLEPNLTLGEQSEVWAYSFRVCVLMTLVAVIPVPWQTVTMPPSSTPVEAVPAPTWTQRGRWLLLALIPSSLLLSVTAHLTTDVAAIPLLWLIPLALYLLTFTIVFARKEIIAPTILRRWLPLVVIVVLLVMLSESTEPLLVVLGVHLVAFFWLAMICHGELARTRPAASHLTDFYLCLALGGVLGGACNALIAPLIFSGYVEYPLMIVLACAFGMDKALRPTRSDWLWALGVGAGTAVFILAIQSQEQVILDIGKVAVGVMFGLPLLLCYLLQKTPARFVLGITAVVCAGYLAHGAHGVTIHRERSYYGVHRVTRLRNFHRLVHGNIAHGQQNRDLDPDYRGAPLTYYSKAGPIGDVFRVYQGDSRLQKVALVGLGTGSLAAYVQPGQQWKFFEIDPSVKRIAQNRELFSFLADAREPIPIELGDARLQLKKSRDAYGLIVIDAFGSDAIPVHLLTREALALYLDCLEPNGLLAFHISNNYVDLEPVVANLAADANCTAYLRHHGAVDDKEKEEGIMESTWLVVARRPDDLAPLVQAGSWRLARAQPKLRVWTDDYSNLLPVFRWRRAD